MSDERVEAAVMGELPRRHDRTGWIRVQGAPPITDYGRIEGGPEHGTRVPLFGNWRGKRINHGGAVGHEVYLPVLDEAGEHVANEAGEYVYRFSEFVAYDD